MNNKNGPLSLLLIAYFSFVTIGLPTGILNIGWRYMQRDFHVDLASYGILSIVSTAGYLLSSVLVGRAIGRLGIGNSMLLGTVISAIGTLGFSMAPFWEALLIASFFSSIGGGFIDAGLNTFVAANYSTGRLNWLHAAYGVGATLGPLLATFVITQLEMSWRFNYAVVLVMLTIFIFCLIFTRTQWTLSPTEREGSEPVEAVGILEALRMPMVVLLISFFFVYGGVEITTGQMANPLFVDGRGISQETAGFWIGMYWGTFTTGRVLTGFIADRVSARVMLRTGMAGVIIGALLLTTNIVPGISFFGLVLMGFAQAPMFATFIAETPRRVGLRFAPTTIGLEVGMCALGIALLPGLAGLLAQNISLEIIGPFLIVLSVILLGLYEMVLLREGRLPQAVPASQD
jgi:fucose permease